ncbi:hypothetical protein JCM13304A_12390 [Desulfothermus okinawensis JCM 13304]
MSVIINTIAIIFFIIGLIFFTGGTVGIIRMPDFYTRLHPAGKLDTMGLMSFVIGFFIYNLQHFTWGNLIVSLKMLLIVFFVSLSSPTATHAIVDAGIRAGLRPWTKKDQEK